MLKYRLSPEYINLLRNFLQKDILDPQIITTLPYSSKLFLEKLPIWTDKVTSDFKKKDRKIERSALKYLTRVAAKTSPFGKFTTLQLVKEKNQAFFFKEIKTSNIKFLDLICKKISRIKSFRNFLEITLNSSILLHEDCIYFVNNQNNEEELQKLEFDDTINFFYSLFLEHNKLIFKDIVEIIDDPAAEDYILQLIEIGFLSFEFPFQKNLNSFSIIYQLFFQNELEILPEDSFEVNELKLLLEAILQQKNIPSLNNFSLRNEEQYFFDVSSHYEDLFNLNTQFLPLYQEVSALFIKLQKVVKCLNFNVLESRKNAILNNLEVEEIPFLEFYISLFHQQNECLNFEISTDFFDDIIEKSIDFSNPEIVTIDEKTLDKILSQLSEKDTSVTCPSFNLVLQPFLEDSTPKAILNGASIGFGKQFGRFLPLFDDEVVDIFRQRNLSSIEQLAELNDASFFNGNLHPNLLEFSINTPNTLSLSENTIPIEQLTVRKESNQWSLFDSKSNEKIIPLDLGLEHPSFRSPLFQLLNVFSYSVVNFRLLNNSINKFFSEKNMPRIVIGENLILQRRTWLFSIEELPILKKNESEKSYFERVLVWKNEQKLPNVVFVSIPHYQPESSSVNPDAEPQRDDYKPQLIDFQNVLLITLLARIILKVPSILQIEEMYPTENQILTLDEKKYMLEAVIQIDKN